jgi:hypothetical protein
MLLGQATYALMWWNTLPLIGLGVTAAYLAAALPYEVCFFIGRLHFREDDRIDRRN